MPDMYGWTDENATFAKWLNISRVGGSGKRSRNKVSDANTASKDIKKNRNNFRRLR